MGIRKTILFLLLFILTISASGQYYETGQDPSRLKWLQIKSDRFTIIYPEKYGEAGIDFARSLDESYSDITRLFPARKFRIPVVIHNFTTQSNGYVAWAPKRVEIYPTPEQNTIPLDQNRQLSLHELTHVMQMESLNTGFSKAMSFLFGEQFPGAMASLLPLWYMEGDAVFAESVLTESGRGRSPGFIRELKALTLERGHLYKYDKMVNGSFKNYIPDHYQLGYQIVTWSYITNNPDLWNKTLKFTANQPFTLNPVNISLRQNAGLTKKTLFIQAFDTLKSLWKEELAKSRAVSYETINPAKKNEYINYYSPRVAGRDSLIAVKTSLSAPPSIVLIDPSSGTEKRIFTPGNLYPFIISSGAGKLVWTETRDDPRWENRNYSVIRILDLKTGIARQLTYGSRYMAASISPDARRIAACENTSDNQNNLVLINPDDGYVSLSIPAPGNVFLQHPGWSDNGEKITVIYLTEEGEGIMSFDPADNSWRVLTGPGRDDIQSVFLRNDSLFYISSVSGTDDIYLLTPDKIIRKITRSAFGASEFTLNGRSVIFSNYSSSGNNICIAPLDDNTEYIPAVNRSFLIDRISLEEKPVDNKPSADYDPEPYRKWQHLSGIHSWMPFYADLETVQSDPTSIRPGATVLSQNHLSTMIYSVGYQYSEDKRHLFHSRITWKGWYPVIDTRLDYGYKPEIDYASENVTIAPDRLSQGVRSTTRIYIPLQFTTGKFTHTIYPYLSADYRNRSVYIKEKNSFDEGQIQFTGRLFLSNNHRSAMRDIFPRWAQVIDLAYSWAPFDELIYGTDLSLKSAFYFPGLFKNNGIRIRFEKEKQDFARYIASNRVRFPRGYHNIVSTKLDFLSVDYVTPLLYPDFSIGSLFYLTRIRTGLFYDYARGTDNFYLKATSGGMAIDSRVSGPEKFSSFGLELLSDFYLFRIPFPVSAGVLTTWKSIGGRPFFELLFNIDIYGMNIGRSGNRSILPLQ